MSTDLNAENLADAFETILKNGLGPDIYGICEHCGNDNHKTSECRSYWCEHCDTLRRSGDTKVDPLGHTKSRCPMLLRCTKCQQDTHASEECHALFCDYCASMISEGKTINRKGKEVRPLGHTRAECLNLMTCDYCHEDGHNVKQCYQRKSKEETCASCKLPWHRGKCPEYCTHCKKFNHTASSCYELHPCQKCGKPGHVSLSCVKQPTKATTGASKGKSGRLRG